MWRTKALAPLLILLVASTAALAASSYPAHPGLRPLSALAQGTLTRARPSREAVLRRPPPTVELGFVAAVVCPSGQRPSADTVLVEPGGRVREAKICTGIREPLVQVQDERGLSVVRREAIAAEDPSLLAALLQPSLAPGRYTVRWRVPLANGETSEGVYSFTINPQGGNPNLTGTILLTLASAGGAALLGLVLYFLRRRLAIPGTPPTGLGHPPPSAPSHEHDAPSVRHTA